MSLMPFQKGAISWLSARPAAFLALEQGLGKTVVASCDIQAPAIVVCPASMKYTWAAELAKWRPDLSVQVIRSSKCKVGGCDVTIVNYDILDRFQLPSPMTLIADESHYAKNYKAKRTKSLIKLIKQSKHVRLLSGTPIVNRPIEIWPLLHAIGGTKLGYFEFGMRYCAGWKTHWNTYDFSGASRMDELNDLLNPVMLRLTKVQVLPELPEKSFRVVELDLPVDKREKQFNVEDIEKNPEPIAFEAMPDILHMNALRKAPMAIQHIRDALESSSKVVVFAHHSDVVQELLSGLSDFNPVRVVGADKPEARQASVDKFQTDQSCRVFVGNIKAAGVGLTLTAASHVIFVESSWTPSDIQQCADRCHRIGQKNSVLVEILTIHKSIDARMLHSALGKMEVINLIIKDTDMNTLNNASIASKLRELAELFDQSQAKVENAAPVQSEPEVKPEPQVKTETKSEATIEQVREALAQLIDAGKREAAMKILKDNGANKVGELVDEKFAAVVAACVQAKG